jgi:hypothetical protein
MKRVTLVLNRIHFLCNEWCMHACEKKNWFSLFVSKCLDCFNLDVETLVFVALAHVRG